jgi:hypothetical protein
MENPAPEMNETVESVSLQSPFCGSLRSKKFFMLDVIPSAPEDYIDASNHCWCRETQQVIGLDGGRVTPERCVPGRSCYRSALDES